MEWRTRETAPKDGTRVLLSIGEDVEILAWGCVRGGEYRWCGLLSYIDDETIIDGWMPLPDPMRSKTP